MNKQLSTTTHPVGRIISDLLKETSIKESELARQTGVPQTTINRMLLGETIDPRANTLKPIAKFFGVTIGQLLGEEPIFADRVQGTFSSYNRNAWNNVPIIQWEEALSWIFTKEKYNLNSHKKWIITEKNVSENSYGLLSKPFMEPRFKRNSILIIDPNCQHQDGKFAIITLDQVTVTIRQLTFDGSLIYLKHFDPTIPTIKFDDNIHRILGYIIEARIDL